ncbi:hypothetical protein ACEW7V_02480 [Areca yellow leaf disease phytoplasma]|uniref:hypothetical protein n=1 Tax=Areca yellow leaf disease phytoplasma TaxID=927614 RepID=UPI0035B54B97
MHYNGRSDVRRIPESKRVPAFMKTPKSLDKSVSINIIIKGRGQEVPKQTIEIINKVKKI